ncbi:DNA-binding transcriptional regulator YbjK [Microbacterium foliorum]|uniref:TetR/AcrR family transcriptional regulator n=1 Tax=Microbacterium foliorum TaxID=104336 RepID=UPI0020A1C3F0|nr:TetR family transcriptional regulator [Microbacterium foliorum]MCP1428997.1 DNA-binding transcriptional regulator YbjK [Microbacterium foliorum]
MGSGLASTEKDRRERIVEAALGVITAHGVHRTTHRKIAAAATVPLGSVTYYFTSLEDVICSAFEALMTTMSARYAAALDAAEDRSAACDAVTELLCGDSFASDGELAAIYELYAFSNHNDRAHRLMAGWLALSRASLSRHFSTEASQAIDAFVEGRLIHRPLEPRELDRTTVRRAVTALAVALP